VSEANINIREIKPEDNKEIEQVIRNCFYEYKLPLIGTAYEDPETKTMYESYQNDNDVYLVLIENNIVIGGGGIKALRDFEGGVCELQKLYFSPDARGKGLGRKLTEMLLAKAREFGYKTCYLESASVLKEAVYLYEKMDFKFIDGPLGNTGHHACGVFMTKTL